MVMRHWILAPLSGACGRCSAIIQAGELVQLVTLPGLERPLWRCQVCAEGPVPSQIAPPRHEDSPRRVFSFSAVKDLASDWKARQAGER